MSQPVVRYSVALALAAARQITVSPSSPLMYNLRNKIEQSAQSRLSKRVEALDRLAKRCALFYGSAKLSVLKD